MAIVYSLTDTDDKHHDGNIISQSGSELLLKLNIVISDQDLDQDVSTTQIVVTEDHVDRIGHPDTSIIVFIRPSLKMFFLIALISFLSNPLLSL
jgi:hypothetical protein